METATVSNQQTARGGALACLHCGQPASDGHEFCCSGCEAAYAAKDMIADGLRFAALAREGDDGSFTLSLQVEGIHCASCIRLIENALLSSEDVVDARVNMSTERLTYSWQGERAVGDKLAATVSKLGYKLYALDEGKIAADETQKSLLKAIAVSGFAAANMMLISIGLWSSEAEVMGLATRDLFHWVSALIALPTVLYAGQPFFRSALLVLKEGRANMDVPISLAVVLASVMSLSETMRQGEYVYFDSAVMLLFFLLIGRYLDARARGRARERASNLLSKLVGVATIVDENGLTQTPIRDLRENDLVLVASGEAIPADGVVEKGESATDMSLITGETLPQAVSKGASVFAGTINIDAPLYVRVAKASEDSLLSDIVRLMETAEQSGASYVRLADRAARLYTPVVHAMGALTFIGWWLLFGAAWQVALLHAVTVLIITCPCALGLAVPVVQVVASSKLMRSGVLLKSGDALERLAKVDTIVFDKTGTLTLGCPQLQSDNHTSDQMKLAASLAVQSKHPLSLALSAAYEGDVYELPVIEVPGCGLEATWEGKRVRLGSRNWCGDAEAEQTASAMELWLNIDGVPANCFRFADMLRTDAIDTIEALMSYGLDIRLLSGDQKAIVSAVANETGIQNFAAEVTPSDKYQYLNELKQEGRQVMMVGDGLNDAPALAAAAVSMSPSTAVDIAQNTADIVFQGERLMPVLDTIRTARFSTRLVKQNFGLAALYNIVAIPAAVLGHVTPLIAAIAMSGSSLVVIANAFRLNLKSKR